MAERRPRTREPKAAISSTALLSLFFQTGQDAGAEKQGLTSIDLTQCGK